jgi:putative polyhydroxyalkanoate system protein
LLIRRYHKLGLEEAKRRVDQVAEELGGKLQLTGRWEGNHMNVKGRGVTGQIFVSDTSVEIRVHLGLTMIMFRDSVRSAIEESIDDFIS